MSELQLHFDRISWLLIHQAKESEQSPSFRISLLKFPRFHQSNDVRTLSQYVCARSARFANVQKKNMSHNFVRHIRIICKNVFRRISALWNLLPLDNTEMLIINTISEICCLRGTFLGYDYRKLVEVNPQKVSFISEISNEIV